MALPSLSALAPLQELKDEASKSLKALEERWQSVNNGAFVIGAVIEEKVHTKLSQRLKTHPSFVLPCTNFFFPFFDLFLLIC